MNEEYTKVVLALIREKAEGREDDYRQSICSLAKLLENDGKIELAEYVLAQNDIGPVFTTQ